VLVDLNLPQTFISEDQGADLTHFSLCRVEFIGFPLPHVNIAIERARSDDVELLSIGDPVNGISVCTPLEYDLDITRGKLDFCLRGRSTCINACNESRRFLLGDD
jgi:hypothetical protein